MLIELSIENYLSIHEKQTLTLVANKSDDKPGNVFSGDKSANLRILRSAAIYGANAAGKTNFMLAMRTMADIVKNSASKYQEGDELDVVSFGLHTDSVDSPSEFEVVFLAEGIRYQYGFSASNEMIHDEWLFAYPKGRPQKWFTRQWDGNKDDYDWEFGAYLQGEKNVWQKSTRQNALFLSTAVQLNSNQLKPIYTWFSNTLRMTGVNVWHNNFTASLCQSEKKSEILKFLKNANIDIEDIKVDKDKFNVDSLPQSMPDDVKKAMASNLSDKDFFDITTYHKNNQGELIAFDIGAESHGTQKLFSLAGPWIDSCQSGRVLFIDELNDALHPKLVMYLVGLFNNPSINTSGAQLIFTTHETSILNQEVFRRDQIWFCEKNNLGESRLYPLTDYSPRKGRENLEAGYLDGRYGAIPYIANIEV